MSKQPTLYGRGELLVVLDIQRQTARVTRLLRTEFLAALAGLVLTLALLGWNFPLFQVTNDFEYTWSITGGMLVGGLQLDSIPLTTFNPVALVAYLGVALALASTLVFFVGNLVCALRHAGTSRPLGLTGKGWLTCKLVIGVSATLAGLLFLCFEPVYKLTMTGEGHAYMQSLAANYAFNCNPTPPGYPVDVGLLFCRYLLSVLRHPAQQVLEEVPGRVLPAGAGDAAALLLAVRLSASPLRHGPVHHFVPLSLPSGPQYLQ